MQDSFQDFAPSISAPAYGGFAITPADGADLTELTRSLYIGTPGAVSVIMHSGAQLTFAGVTAGTVLPLRVRRVRATGTTATAIVGLV